MHIFTAEERLQRQTCWSIDEAHVILEKKVKIIGYECCQVLATGVITDPCWSCGGPGKYFERIPMHHPIKATNPYAAFEHKIGDKEWQVGDVL